MDMGIIRLVFLVVMGVVAWHLRPFGLEPRLVGPPIGVQGFLVEEDEEDALEFVGMLQKSLRVRAENPARPDDRHPHRTANLCCHDL